MIQKRYKTKWRALEAIQAALREDRLISWYGIGSTFVVNLKKSH